MKIIFILIVAAALVKANEECKDEDADFLITQVKKLIQFNADYKEALKTQEKFIRYPYADQIQVDYNAMKDKPEQNDDTSFSTKNPDLQNPPLKLPLLEVESDYDITVAHLKHFTWPETKKCFIRLKDGDKKNDRGGITDENLKDYMTAVKNRRRNLVILNLIISGCNAGSNIIPNDIAYEAQSSPEYVLANKFCPKVGDTTAKNCLLGSVKFDIKEGRISMVDCKAINGWNADQKQPSYTLSWVSFGSDDPTSDLDISVDLPSEVDYTDKNLKKFDALQNHIKTVRKINEIADKAAEGVTALWYENDPKKMRSMEDVLDTNYYPEIANSYKYLFKKEPSQETITYMRFLAALEFGFDTTSSYLMINRCREFEESQLEEQAEKENSNFVDMLDNPQDFCKVMFSEHLRDMKTPSIFKQKLSTQFKNSNKLQGAFVYVSRNLRFFFHFEKEKEDNRKKESLEKSQELKKSKEIGVMDGLLEYEAKREAFTSCFKGIFKEDEKIKSNVFWTMFSIMSTCHNWANEAYISYGALIAFKNTKTMQTVRVYAESSNENMAMLLDHMSEPIIHGEEGMQEKDYDMNNDATDKFKYLQRAVDSLQRKGKYTVLNKGVPEVKTIAIIDNGDFDQFKAIINMVNKFVYYNVDARMDAKSESKKDLFRRIIEMYRFGLDDIIFARLYAKLHTARKTEWIDDDELTEEARAGRIKDLNDYILKSMNKLGIKADRKDPELLKEEVDEIIKSLPNTPEFNNLLYKPMTNEQIINKLANFALEVRKAVQTTLIKAYIDDQKDSIEKLVVQHPSPAQIEDDDILKLKKKESKEIEQNELLDEENSVIDNLIDVNAENTFPMAKCPGSTEDFEQDKTNRIKALPKDTKWFFGLFALRQNIV